MIQRIKEKGSKSTIHHWKDGDNVLTDKADIANRLGETLAKHSSSSNYVPKFQKYQKQQEKKRINFNSVNGEDYNELFSLHELRIALEQAHNTATGADSIPYQLLKHLPKSCLVKTLSVSQK